MTERIGPLEWGFVKDLGPGIGAAWGARGILVLTADGSVKRLDIPHDRQQCVSWACGAVGKRARDDLIAWVNTVALPWVREQTFDSRSTDQLGLRTPPFQLTVSTQRSQGYLYLTATLLR